MDKIKEAMERIKILECPTGEIENRVRGILEDYNVAEGNNILIHRDEKLDTDGAEAYCADLSNNRDKSIIVLAKSGMDDYVVKVVDVYKLNSKNNFGLNELRLEN